MYLCVGRGSLAAAPQYGAADGRVALVPQAAGETVSSVNCQKRALFIPAKAGIHVPKPLERLLGKVSAATIAKRLKRTETSVVMKIKALGHSRRVSEGYTIRDLELCLGEDHHKIQKWIANGWLRDRLQGTRRHDGNGRDIHRFREKDILNFIKNYPHEINLGKIDQTWFLDIVLLRGAELHVCTSRCPTSNNDD